MTGMSSPAARTIAQAIRCVNESFLPAPLSCARRSASSPTDSVRKLVAVGIDRLMSMNRARVAAGPRMTVVSAPSGTGAGGAAGLAEAPLPPPAAAFCTSALVTRPRGPVPVSLEVSTPWSAAKRAATGVALESPLRGGLGGGSAGLGLGGLLLGGGRRPCPTWRRRPRPRYGRARRPRPRSRPASASSSTTVPDTGAGSAASILSVDISARSSPSETWSPALTSHSRRVPSTTESPISGRVTSTISPEPRVLGAGLVRGAVVVPRARRRPPGRRRPRSRTGPGPRSRSRRPRPAAW